MSILDAAYEMGRDDGNAGVQKLTKTKVVAWIQREEADHRLSADEKTDVYDYYLNGYLFGELELDRRHREDPQQKKKGLIFFIDEVRYVKLPKQAEEDEANGMFWIVAEAVPVLEKKLTKLAKKSERLGLPPLTYELIREEQVPLYEAGKRWHIEHDDQRTGSVLYKVVAIEGDAPKFKDWEFVATIQPIEGTDKALLLTAPDVEIPATVRQKLVEKPYHCDHCKKTRRRNETFAVRNTKTGKYKQVGRACIKDFTGHQSPQAIANYYKTLLAVMDDLEKDRDPSNYGGRLTPIIDLEAFFAEIAKETKETGYYYRGLGSTISMRFWGIRGERLAGTEDAEKGKEMLEMILKTLRARPINQLSNYEYNVLTALESGYVEPRTQNIVASSVLIYLRTQEKKARKEKKESNWVGSTGERLSFGTVDCIRTKCIESYYGESQLCIFVDADGNELKWFNSGRTEIESGARYELTGTVKKHETYKDRKSTLLTRCKVKPV